LEERERETTTQTQEKRSIEKRMKAAQSDRSKSNEHTPQQIGSGRQMQHSDRKIVGESEQ
jgi:hypothetical protein